MNTIADTSKLETETSTTGQSNKRSLSPGPDDPNSAKRARQSPSYADLLEELEKVTLSELHTHLLGMGDAAWWLDQVLLDKDKFPSHDAFVTSESIRQNLGPLVWDVDYRCWYDRKKSRELFETIRGGKPVWNTSSVHKKFADMMPRFLATLSRQSVDLSTAFTYDVVISLDNFKKAFSLTKHRDNIAQAQVAEKLGIRNHNDFFREFVVFNARDQELELIYGIQLHDVRRHVAPRRSSQSGGHTSPSQLDARSHLSNAFSMCNADGTFPRSVDFHSFRGSFTPEFYPRRFALKDALYSQRLDVLAYLLQHVLTRYAASKPSVTYVEFSVGCGDICRPWVFDVLITYGTPLNQRGEFHTLLDSFPWLQPLNDLPVDYRFLAGFNRQDVQINGRSLTAEEAVELLYNNPHQAIHSIIQEIHMSRSNTKPSTGNYQPMFAKHDILVGKLTKLARDTTFRQFVVGLDLFGDEHGFPYVPFVSSKCVEFVLLMRTYENTSSNFGVRIHCAENVFQIPSNQPGFRLWIAHMYISYRCIYFIWEQLQFKNVRIGHGIAFAALLATDDVNTRKSGVLLAEMKVLLPALLRYIIMEINQTSNFYLLGSAIRLDNSAVTQLINRRCHVVLSTDDDGVLPINHCRAYLAAQEVFHSENDSFSIMQQHQRHVSLAAEYCNAIHSNQLCDQKLVQAMVHNAATSRFCAKRVTSSTTEIPVLASTNPYLLPVKQFDEVGLRPSRELGPTVVVHPSIVQPMLANSMSKSGMFIAYYTNIYSGVPPLTGQDKWAEVRHYIACAMFHMSVNGDCLDRFKTDCVAIFGSEPEFSKKLYRLCQAVYEVMWQPADRIAYFGVCNTNTKITHLLFSHPPEQTAELQQLNSVLNSVHRPQSHTERIHHYCSHFDFGKEQHLVSHPAQCEIRVHTPSGGTAFPNIGDATDLLLLDHMFYAICPHSSMASAALHLIAQHPTDELELVRCSPRELGLVILPWVPLRLRYPEGRDAFLANFELGSIANWNHSTAEEIAPADGRESFVHEIPIGDDNALVLTIAVSQGLRAKDVIELMDDDSKQAVASILFEQWFKTQEEWGLEPVQYVLLPGHALKVATNRLPSTSVTSTPTPRPYYTYRTAGSPSPGLNSSSARGLFGATPRSTSLTPSSRSTDEIGSFRLPGSITPRVILPSTIVGYHKQRLFCKQVEQCKCRELDADDVYDSWLGGHTDANNKYLLSSAVEYLLQQKRFDVWTTLVLKLLRLLDHRRSSYLNRQVCNEFLTHVFLNGSNVKHFQSKDGLKRLSDAFAPYVLLPNAIFEAVQQDVILPNTTTSVQTQPVGQALSRSSLSSSRSIFEQLKQP